MSMIFSKFIMICTVTGNTLQCLSQFFSQQMRLIKVLYSTMEKFHMESTPLYIKKMEPLNCLFLMWGSREVDDVHHSIGRILIDWHVSFSFWGTTCVNGIWRRSILAVLFPTYGPLGRGAWVNALGHGLVGFGWPWVASFYLIWASLGVR